MVWTLIWSFLFKRSFSEIFRSLKGSWSLEGSESLGESISLDEPGSLEESVTDFCEKFDICGGKF